MSYTLSLPAFDAESDLGVILAAIKSQIANVAQFKITVSEATLAQALPNAVAAAVVTTAPTTGAYGYTQAQATAIVSSLNSLITDVEALRQLNATLVTALANVGIVTIA
jgi:hypothetical protein